MRTVLILTFLVGAAIFAGCQTSRPSTAQPSPTQQPPPAPVTRTVITGKPLLDFSRGAGGFPLSADMMPHSREALVDSLLAGYADRISSVDAGRAVVAFGDHYPDLDALLIDLSDCKIKSEYRPAIFHSVGKLSPAMHLGYIQYVATPLTYVDGKTNLRISARDVRLGMLKGRGEGAALVMTDARDGRVYFDVTLQDLRSMLLTTVKSSASKAGYLVQDVQLKITSDDSRSLACEMHVSGSWLLLPTSFKLTARLNVNEDYTVRFSKVACTGEDVGGVLLAGFVDKAIRKYDGRVMPLAAFPAGRIHIHDLRISVDDSIHLFVAFGN